MDGLSEGEILALWDRGRRASAVERARLLAAAASPQLDAPQRAQQRVGARDGAVLQLRIATYGADAVAYLPCNACDEALEAPLDLRALHLPPPARASLTIDDDPWRLELRAPTVAEVEEATTSASPKSTLLRHVVIEASRSGDPVDPARLPDEIVAQVDRALEELDPQADLRLSQTCPACGQAFEAVFDVVTFLWHELDVDARRILQEVDLLARAYGWSEAEILGLGRTRRAAYLEMAMAR